MRAAIGEDGAMSERPEQLDRLYVAQATAKLAHETIFGLNRRLLDRGTEAAESSQLVGESAQIVLVRLPGLTASVRRLGTRWDEESLLDPAAASDTARQIGEQFAVLEAELRALLTRQVEIARQLRALLDR
jgi:hypothetical protein